MSATDLECGKCLMTCYHYYSYSLLVQQHHFEPNSPLRALDRVLLRLFDLLIESFFVKR
jgi:hypothetical protein